MIRANGEFSAGEFLNGVRIIGMPRQHRVTRLNANITICAGVGMTASSHILGSAPIHVRIDGRDVRLTLAEAKVLQAGLGRAIAKVERFERGVEGLISRSDAASSSGAVIR